MVKGVMSVRDILNHHMGTARRPIISDAELAKRLGYASNSPVSMVRRGVRKISDKMISRWADALRLTGKDREEFVEVAHLELAPPWIQQQYFKLKGRIDQLERDAERLEKLNDSDA